LLEAKKYLARKPKKVGTKIQCNNGGGIFKVIKCIDYTWLTGSKKKNKDYLIELERVLQ